MKVYEEHHIDSLGQDIRGVLQDHWCSGSKMLIEERSTFCIPFVQITRFGWLPGREKG